MNKYSVFISGANWIAVNKESTDFVAQTEKALADGYTFEGTFDAENEQDAINQAKVRKHNPPQKSSSKRGQHTPNMSGYGLARLLAKIHVVVGMFAFVIGLIGFLFLVINSYSFNLLSAMPGLIVAFSGLALAGFGQVIRAQIDTAIHTREAMLALSKRT